MLYKTNFRLINENNFNILHNNFLHCPSYGMRKSKKKKILPIETEGTKLSLAHIFINYFSVSEGRDWYLKW